MNFRNFLLPVLLVASGAIYLSSCSDDEADAVDFTESQEVSADYNVSQSEMDQLMSYTDEAVRTAAGGRYKAGDLYCASFLHDSTGRTITLDFGTTGCLGKDGRTRKGKIIVTYIGRAEELGANARSIAFQNYSVDGNGVSGTLSATKWTIVSGSPELTSTLTATNLTVTFAEDGTTFKTNGAWARKITIDPVNFLNTSYSISGESTGTTREGKTYISTITAPIAFKLSCLQTKNPYAVSGVQEISVATVIPFTVKINYGTGDCDKILTITVNGQSTEYTLP